MPPTEIRWNEKLYFESLGSQGASIEVQTLARELREFGGQFPGSVTFNWGTGQKGTMVLKRNGGGLIEVRATGKMRFRPNKFSRALGEDGARKYQQGLEKLVPNAMKMGYPLVTASEARKVAPAVLELVKRTLQETEGRTSLLSNVDAKSAAQ